MFKNSGSGKHTEEYLVWLTSKEKSSLENLDIGWKSVKSQTKNSEILSKNNSSRKLIFTVSVVFIIFEKGHGIQCV